MHFQCMVLFRRRNCELFTCLDMESSVARVVYMYIMDPHKHDTDMASGNVQSVNVWLVHYNLESI